MPSGFQLGAWVSSQRAKASKMSPERRSRLAALPGWAWEKNTELWEEGFMHFQAFIEREGHAKVSQKYQTESGFRLGLWVSAQRTRKAQLPSERKVRLESLQGWTWDAIDAKWDDWFLHLRDFAEKEGHANVPWNHRIESGLNLGDWVAKQRRQMQEMPPLRRAKLEGLPEWTWQVGR